MLAMMRWHSIPASVVLCGALLSAQSKSDPSSPAALIGTWQGTSTCSDRAAAPACQDETVVYEFTAGAKAGTIRWAADKIVNGQRLPMGEMDLEYDKTGPYWKATFTSPRVKTEWRLSVDGDHLTGTGRLLPGNEVIRKVDLKRSPSPPRSGATDLQSPSTRSRGAAGRVIHAVVYCAHSQRVQSSTIRLPSLQEQCHGYSNVRWRHGGRLRDCRAGRRG